MITEVTGQCHSVQATPPLRGLGMEGAGGWDSADVDRGGSGGDRVRSEGWVVVDADREGHRPGDLGRLAGDQAELDQDQGLSDGRGRRRRPAQTRPPPRPQGRAGPGPEDAGASGSETVPHAAPDRGPG